MPTDKQMLDWLEEQNKRSTYTGQCVFRWSQTGRGWRLHECSSTEGFETVRKAIAAAMHFDNLSKAVIRKMVDRDQLVRNEIIMLGDGKK